MYEMKINDHPTKNYLSYKKLFKIKTIRIRTGRRGQKNFQNKKIEKRQKDKKTKRNQTCELAYSLVD